MGDPSVLEPPTLSVCVCVIPTSEGRPSSHIGKSRIIFPHSVFRLCLVFMYNVLSKVIYISNIYKDIEKREEKK